MDVTRRAEWDDPLVCQLETLLANNLISIFSSASKKIVELGYTEEVAERAILCTHLLHCGNDMISDVINQASDLLTKERQFGVQVNPVFGGFKDLANYMILESINVVREVRPTLSLVEAMWCLLISDLDVKNACTMEGPNYCGEASGECQPSFQSTYSENILIYNNGVVAALMGLKQARERELQGWTDWANEKVMQIAQRLGKDSAELRMLRQEKQESDKFKMGRLLLEDALSNSKLRTDTMNSTIHKLEEENVRLKAERTSSQMVALGSALDLKEALQREQAALEKMQSCNVEKGSLSEELLKARQHVATLNVQLEEAKRCHDKFEELWKHEENEKLKIVEQINVLRIKREDEDLRARAKEEKVKQEAERDMQKCQENINKLEKMIAKLRADSERSKIAALRMGYGSSISGYGMPKTRKRLPVFEDIVGSMEFKSERECAMCMNEEISVVFLPCKHQVVCGECSASLEKQGMNECPSCRTPVMMRIQALYRY